MVAERRMSIAAIPIAARSHQAGKDPAPAKPGSGGKRAIKAERKRTHLIPSLARWVDKTGQPSVPTVILSVVAGSKTVSRRAGHYIIDLAPRRT
jgi:hypothetical protein